MSGRGPQARASTAAPRWCIAPPQARPLRSAAVCPVSENKPCAMLPVTMVCKGGTGMHPGLICAPPLINPPRSNGMRLQVETTREAGRKLSLAFHFNARRVEVVNVIDQWFGPDYRYCKVKGDDGAVYILRVVEHCSDWQLTLFSSPRVQAVAASSGT